jgi:hypothetical protein
MHNFVKLPSNPYNLTINIADAGSSNPNTNYRYDRVPSSVGSREQTGKSSMS